MMRSLAVLIVLLCSQVAWTQARTLPVVHFSTRSGHSIYGHVVRYADGAYQVATQGRTLRIPASAIRFMRYAPKHVPPGALGRPRRVVSRPRPLTEQQILEMAIAEFRKERKAKKIAKRSLPSADGALGKVMDSVKDSFTEKVQDNLFDVLLKDKELQSIVMDKNIQKTMESGDYLSLLNNQKILDLMRNPNKVDKLTKGLLKDKEEEEKKKEKKEKK